MDFLDDPSRCPSCVAALTPGFGLCPRCRLDLSSPILHQVRDLSSRAAALLRERQGLLDLVPREPVPPAATPVWTAPVAPPGASGAHKDATPLSVRTALLGLGAVLLTVSAAIFLAFAWRQLGLGGRTALMGLVTALSAVASGVSLRRRLPATAETFGAITVGLLLLDAAALQRLVDTGLPGPLYWALVLAVIAGSALAARGLQAARVTTTVAGQLVLPLIALDLLGAAPALLLGAQAIALVAVESRVRGTAGRAVQTLLLTGLCFTAAEALLASLALLDGGDGIPRDVGAVGLLLLGLAALIGALGRRDVGTVRDYGAGTAAGFGLAAAFGFAAVHELSPYWAGPFAALLALGLVVALGRVADRWRSGPVVAALGTLTIAGLARSLDLVAAYLAPLSWWLTPWQADWREPVAGLLGSDASFPSIAPGMIVLAIAAIVLALVGQLLPARARLARRSAAGLALAALAGAPAALPFAVPLIVAIGWQLTLAAVVVALAVKLADRAESPALMVAASALLALAVSGSMASEPTALLALSAAAGLLALAAYALPSGHGSVWAGVATLVAVGDAAATARSVELTPRAAGAIAAIVAAVLVAGFSLLGRSGRREVESAAAVAYVVGLVSAAPDLRALGWASLAGALGAAVVVGRADRRALAPVPAALACLAAPLLVSGYGGSALATVLVAATVACAVALLGTHAAPRFRIPSTPVETVGGAAYAVALLAAAATVGASWIAVVLTMGGVSAAGMALGGAGSLLRPDRVAFRWASFALLTAALWVRLGAADLHVIEAYTVPPALVLLLIGLLRRRQEPGTGSWAAYGSALSLGLGSSLVVSLGDGQLGRALALAAAALAVTLIGAQHRLQAPLVIGGAALAVVAVDQFGPYAVLLPRWVVIGAAGALLLGLGATYERRLRDAKVLRERYDAMA